MPTTNQSPSPPTDNLSLYVFDADPCSRCGMERDSAEAVTYGSICEDCWASQFPARANGVVSGARDRVLLRSDPPLRKEFPW